MTTKDHPYVYRKSLSDAKRYDEVEAWRQSFLLNIACKHAIEDAIAGGFDGMYLEQDCINDVIGEFGFQRTAWVLAWTIRSKDYDGRFSPDNKAWAKDIHIPQSDRNTAFTVESHPAVLNGFVSQYRKAFGELGLISPKVCQPTSGEDLTGKVLLLSHDVLRESCWKQENQLWLACSGFGCSPTALGRAVYAVCLGDGEKARWDRHDFEGILPEDRLPQWAADRLSELRQADQLSAAPSMTENTL